VSNKLDIVQNVIREERSKRSISQATLASALGVSRQTINSIETGRYLPSLPLAFALAAYFDTTIEALFQPSEGDV
jgi:putative transcriptional regulator